MGPSQRANWQGGVLALLALWPVAQLTLGCANVIGADEYKVGTKPDGGGAGGGGAGGGGAGGGAGDGGAVTAMPAGSGETLCAPGCGSGLTCSQTSFGPSGMCSYPCATDKDCAAGHSCIGADNLLAYSCMKICPDETCPTDFVCVHLSKGPATCFPHDWVLGVGDPCTSGGQCPSGQCYGEPAGFCTRVCTPGDACAGAHAGLNSEGDRNACTQVKGMLLCVPGCNVDATCGAYENTTCRALVSGTEICLP